MSCVLKKSPPSSNQKRFRDENGQVNFWWQLKNMSLNKNYHHLFAEDNIQKQLIYFCHTKYNKTKSFLVITWTKFGHAIKMNKIFLKLTIIQFQATIITMFLILGE